MENQRYNIHAIKDDKSIYCGDMERDDNGEYIEIYLTVYSDYHGGVVEKSNCDEFLERFKEVEGVHEFYGGYGTRGVLVKYDVFTSNEEIQEVMMQLERYPSLNDDRWSELEQEIENESWDDWIKSDLISELEKRDIPYNEDELYSKFFKLSDEIGEYFECESHNSGYIDVEKIVNSWV